MSALVSVIVPTLNAERYLAEALDSIAAQTYTRWEVVLVDGGSTDGTLAVADRYDGVRVVAQRGRGLADAWNCGLDEARGELIAFLDSDDRWADDKLSRQVAALEADAGIACVIANVRFVLEPGSELPPGLAPAVLETDHVASMPSALLARRELFDRVGSFDTALTITPDIDWFRRVSDAQERLAVVPELLVYKRVHDRNLSTLGAAQYGPELLGLLRESVSRRRRAG
jgi:glycosyltransferase involved in cell wall biosynthesis